MQSELSPIRFETRPDMSGVAHIAEITTFRLRERQSRNERDAVIPFLPVDLDKLVTGAAQVRKRKFGIAAFGFLETEHVRLMLLQEVNDQRHAKPNGIDVPGRDFQQQGRVLQDIDAA
jgi:hypothetical protein